MEQQYMYQHISAENHTHLECFGIVGKGKVEIICSSILTGIWVIMSLQWIRYLFT